MRKFFSKRNHGFLKESKFSIDAAYRYLPVDRRSGALVDTLLCWQDDHDHSRWRPRWLGRISIQSSDAVFEEVHTGQPQHHDGVHGRRLGEKGGELLLYGETRWAKDRLRRREPTPLTGEEVDKAVRELPRDVKVIALYKKLAWRTVAVAIKVVAMLSLLLPQPFQFRAGAVGFIKVRWAILLSGAK